MRKIILSRLLITSGLLLVFGGLFFLTTHLTHLTVKAQPIDGTTGAKCFNYGNRSSRNAGNPSNVCGLLAEKKIRKEPNY